MTCPDGRPLGDGLSPARLGRVAVAAMGLRGAERVDLDVDLTKEVRCRGRDCGRPAVWLALARHADDTPCGPYPYCARHREVLDAICARVASGARRLVCKWHGLDSLITWRKL